MKGDISVARYSAALRDVWDDLAVRAKNSLFLHLRGYMDYHSDRFSDASVIVYHAGNPVALFPAAYHASNNCVASHNGLTFGGVITDSNVRSNIVLAIVEALCVHYRNEGISQLLIKPIPAVFCKYPSGEIDYALWKNGFSLVRRDLASILPINNSLPFNSSKKYGVKKAVNSGVEIRAEGLSGFHALLSQILETYHEVAPVHTLHELELLMSRFPGNIFLRAAYVDEGIVAGTLVYNYGHVWHTQYLASSEKGRKVAALDFVISSLIEEARLAGCKFLSFGTSTTDEGRVLNEGLIWQKESFGARGITHDFYALEF